MHGNAMNAPDDRTVADAVSVSLSVRRRAHGSERTVLLLGNYRPTLVVARRLKAEGWRVMSSLAGCDHGAELSRGVDEIWDHPTPADDADGFRRALDRLLAARADIACVFPIDEAYVRLFAERRPALPAHVTLAMVSGDTVLQCLDKLHMMTLARDARVPVAPFAEVTSLHALATKAAEIGFPLVARPQASTDRLFGQKAITLQDEADLKRVFAGWPQGQRSLLIQRHARGRRHNFYFAALNGEMRRSLHAIITRTDRLDGSGLAIDGVTVTPDPDLTRHTQALVARLNYSGIGCAQFLVDEDTGAVSFLEINARIAGNHAVPDALGLDLDGFLMAVSDGGEKAHALAARPHGRAGLRYSWVAGDLQGLKENLQRGDLSAFEVLSWLRALVATARASDLDMMLNRQDPWPGIVTLINALPFVGRVTRRPQLWRKLLPKPYVTLDDSAMSAIAADREPSSAAAPSSSRTAP